MKKIMNEERDLNHYMVADVVERPQDCVNINAMLKASK